MRAPRHKYPLFQTAGDKVLWSFELWSPDFQGYRDVVETEMSTPWVERHAKDLPEQQSMRWIIRKYWFALLQTVGDTELRLSKLWYMSANDDS